VFAGVSAEPTFVLSGPAGTLIGNGIRTPYSSVAKASAALARGEASIVLGALPFDLAAPAALHAPQTVVHTDALPEWAAVPMPTARIDATLPALQEHRARVARAVQQLRDPESPLHKVVLARALRLIADRPWNTRSILRRLVAADPSANAYLVDLSPAGGEYLGTVLIGASPELLVARDGDRVTCRPFAGSAPRATDPATDRGNGAALAESGKNRHEHQLVIDAMREVLDPLCVDLDVAATPQLHATDALWHLSTPISGRLRETSTTAIDLALALHPTPAVGGVPTKAATALIEELEGDRGFYAGAVGWCDAGGDGRFVVSIRGAQLSADRRTAVAHSGGGIVAESDPDDEVDETTTKLTTIMTGLGATP
jgi:isochorismate synthase